MSDKNELTKELFDTIEDTRAGMLGVEGSGQHTQPMHPYLDRQEQCLYFITAADTDLVRAIDGASTAHFCVVSKKQDLHACLKGPLTVSTDEAKLDEIWNAVAAAWFEGGRQDARVTLLAMPVTEAAVWKTDAGVLGFALEIARSNARTEHTPDVGSHEVLNFARAA